MREISNMTIHKRVELTPASGLISIYKKRFRLGQRWDVKVFKEGAKITPDMFVALKELNELVKNNGGRMYIIDLYRSWETQAAARQDFKNGKKKDFVAKPGSSFHNAGRAVDIAIQELNFIGKNHDEWLSVLWDLTKPLGFRPIIRLPDIDASEAWHFDFPGKDWSDAYRTLSYPEVAKCCILDVGKWNPDVSTEKTRKMFIQSQLIRLGFYEIGVIDGQFGPKTNRILAKYGVNGFDTITLAETLSKR